MTNYSVWVNLGLKDKMTPQMKKATRSVSHFGSVLRGILGANLARFGFIQLTNQVSSFFTAIRQIEDAQAAFTPMMKSVWKAKRLVAALNEEAAVTPFQFEGISNIAKRLLPITQDINEIRETFRMLGDTAGGNMERLERITHGYSMALLKGKIDMRAMNIMIRAGLPVMPEMSKKLGVTTEKLYAMIRAGEVTSDTLTDVFKVMTDKGGIFYKGMEIASRTLSGRLSTLRDNVILAKAAIVTALLPGIKATIVQLIEVARNVRKWANANQQVLRQNFQAFTSTLMSIVRSLPTIADWMGRIYKISMSIIRLWVAFNIRAWLTTIIAKTSLWAIELGGVNGMILLINGSLKKMWTALGPLGWAILAVWAFVEAFFYMGGTVKQLGQVIVKFLLSPINFLIDQMLILPKLIDAIFGTSWSKGAAGTIDEINKSLTGSGAYDFAGIITSDADELARKEMARYNKPSDAYLAAQQRIKLEVGGKFEAAVPEGSAVALSINGQNINTWTSGLGAQ